MSKQLHNNFTDEQVKTLLKSFLTKEIKINYVLALGNTEHKRSGFFVLLEKYTRDPDTFSIQYKRKTISLKIDSAVYK